MAPKTKKRPAPLPAKQSQHTKLKQNASAKKAPTLKKSKSKQKQLQAEVRTSVVDRAKESTKQIKEQAAAVNKLKKAHTQELSTLNSQVDHQDHLKSPEHREKFFSKLKTQLKTQLVLLISSGKLDYNKFKHRPLADTLSDLTDNLGNLKVKKGNKTRPLTPDEKNIFKISNKLPRHHFSEVTSDFIQLEKNLKSEIIIPLAITNHLTAKAAKKKPKLPPKLTKNEKKDAENAIAAFANQHPFVTAGALLTASVGAYAGLSWIGNKLSGLFSSSKPATSTTPTTTPTPAAPAKKSSLPWTATKYALGAAVGTFAAGILLDKKSSLGFIGQGLEKAGIKTDENRVFKSLTLFSQGVLSFSGRKFLDSWMTLKLDIDKNRKLHDSIASKLDMKGSESHLRYIGHLKYADLLLQEKDTKKSLASKAIGYIPGFLKKYLAPEKEFISQEQKLRTILRQQIIKHKIKPTPGATIDHVLSQLDKKISRDSLNDLSVRNELTKEEQKNVAKAQRREELQVLQTKVLTEKIDKKKQITKKEKERLLASTSDLQKTATKLNQAIPGHWDRILGELNKLGLTHYISTKNTPNPINRKQRVDFIAARSSLLKQFSKKESKILNVIIGEIGTFQTLVQSIKPGQPIDAKSLKKFNELRKKIYSPKGYAATIQQALHRANNATARDYRKAIKAPLTTKKVLESGGKIILYGVLGPWEFIAKNVEKTGANRYAFLGGIIAIHAAPAAWGFLAPGYLEGTKTTVTTPDGTVVETVTKGAKRSRGAGALRGLITPERLIHEKVKKVGNIEITSRKTPDEKLSAKASKLAKSYEKYKAKAIKMGRPESKIMSLEKFTKYDKHIRRIGKIAGPIVAFMVIEDIATSRDKKKAIIRQGINLGAVLAASIGVGLRTKHPLAAPVTAVITGLAMTFGLDHYVKSIVDDINDAIVADPKREAWAKTIAETTNIALFGNVIQFSSKWIGEGWRHFRPSVDVGNFYEYMLADYSYGVPFVGIKKTPLNTEEQWLHKVKAAQETLDKQISEINNQIKFKELTPVQKRKLTKKKITLQMMKSSLEYQKPKTMKWYIAEAGKYQGVKDAIKKASLKFATRYQNKKLNAKQLQRKRRDIYLSLSSMDMLDYGNQVRYWNKMAEDFNPLISQSEKKQFLGLIKQKQTMEEVYKRLDVDITKVKIPREIDSKQRKEIEKYYLQLRQLQSS